MKVYLAAMFSKKNELREYAKCLRRLGIVITSEWLRERHALKSKEKSISPKMLQWYAARDKKGIRKCDTFILVTPTDFDLLKVGRSLGELRRLARAAHELECGMADALGKRLIIVGQRMNAFHYLKKYEVYPAWGDLLKKLDAEQGNSARLKSTA